ncbi:hypothetical protein BJ170DRAFT_596569 [Xylariales sp. AK1849]|nr:hypothetical protein BJ170DRAFT_596569 [Xylariales sp. AK1849]
MESSRSDFVSVDITWPETNARQVVTLNMNRFNRTIGHCVQYCCIMIVETISASTSNVAARKAKFLRNYTIPINVTGTLPYNSTIWLDGKAIPLEAPFLSTSAACSDWVWAPLGACLCLNGVPLNQEIDVDNPTGCISDTGYSWGFATRILGVALILEAPWILMTWIMWTWATWRSQLVSRGRAGAGKVRNILDAAEAITEHVGDQHSAYTESELAKQLKTSPPYRYVVEIRGGTEHIGIRPTSTSGTQGTELRKRIQVDGDTLYGLKDMKKRLLQLYITITAKEVGILGLDWLFASDYERVGFNLLVGVLKLSSRDEFMLANISVNNIKRVYILRRLGGRGGFLLPQKA